ncbi:MAG: hypothetical protein JSR39_03395 [Verrucomicrobia bacterium]|nr:hypothetical protein [Verrucomicrobiota bacterium]
MTTQTFSLSKGAIDHYLGIRSQPVFAPAKAASTYLSPPVSEAPRSALPLKERLPVYEGLFGSIWGRVLNLFEHTIAIEDRNGACSYVKVSKLTEELLKPDMGRPAASHFAAQTKQVQQLVLENLQPIIGQPITWEKVEGLFQAFRTSEMLTRLRGADCPAVKQAVSERLESLKHRHLEVLEYGSAEVTSKLKVGDILFKKVHEDDFNPVVLGQTIAYPFMGAPKEREGYKFSHAAIYLGNGRIAEASPHLDGCEVRSLPMNDPRFGLDGVHKTRFLVCRFHDEEIAREAAEIAESVAQPVSAYNGGPGDATEYQYTKVHAMRSLWHTASFGPFARYRYMKQYIDDHKGEKPIDFIDLKSFFCSYFVGYCYQTAESRRVMPAILGEEDAPKKGYTSIGSAIFRGLWARLRRICNWKEMSDAVKLQFDAKRLTPQNFRNFTTAHPELFRDVLMLR